jgi:hypothetical protein
VSCDTSLAGQIEADALSTTLRIINLQYIKRLVKCKTFVSCEPVFEPAIIYDLIKNCDYIDEYKIGKLNYMTKDNPFYPDIDWGEFGRECERLCKEYERNYYIKESLRAEMEKGGSQ